jgi:PAS domain S-box-containing protein
MSNEKKLHSRLEGLFAGLPKGDPAPSGRMRLEPPGPAAPVTPAAFEAELAHDALAVLPGWTWETSSNGVLTGCSPEVTACLGYTPAELAGQPLAQIAYGHESNGARELGELLARQRPMEEVRVALTHKSGSAVWFALNALPRLDDEGTFIGFRGAARMAAAPAAAPVEGPDEVPGPQREPILADPRPETADMAAEPPAAPPPRAPVGLPEAPRTVPLGARWGYVATDAGLEPVADWSAPEADQAWTTGRLVARGGEAEPAEGEAPGARRALAVPIRLQNQTVGVLDFFDDDGTRAWSDDDLALVQAVSDQLGLALENARLFSETREYLDKQTLLYEVTHAAASAVSLNEALNNSAQALARVLPDAVIAILLLDEGRDHLRLRAAVGFPPDLKDSLRIRLGEGLTGWVAQHNRPVLVPDVASDPRYVAGMAGIVSEAAVPLAVGERVIGVLDVESPRPDAFDAEDLQLLSTLAGTLTAIIVNNNLLEQISQERERLAVLYDVLQGLIARPERADILTTALSMATRLGAQHGYVLLLGQTPGQHVFESTLPGLDRLSPREARDLARILSQQGLERWVLEQKQPALVADTQLDARWYSVPREAGREPARSVISVPLKTQRGSLTGVLAYTHSRPGVLGAEHLPQIESIAGQVAVALENALLRQQQGTQSHNAAALARAAQALTRTLDEGELHRIIAGQLFEAFGPNGVALLRWDAAANSFIALAVQVSDAEAPDDRGHWPAVGQALSATRRPDLLEVIHKRQGRIRGLRPEPHDRVRESMVLPLLYGGEIEGVAEVVHTGPVSGLTAVDVELFQAILTAAASALQSARLYELQRQTAERLAEVDRLKSQFLANMSHELRTPLNSIIGFSRVILKGIDGPLSDLQQQDLTSINNAGQHLLGLINDILDMARIEAGKMDLVLDDIDLRDTIKGVLSTTLALVKEKPVQLREEVPDNLPRVRADPMRIRQVLLNLLANAAKFTDIGSITLRAVPVQAVSPRLGRLEPFVEVSVIDTGMGMAPEDLPKLFEPFSQVDASATRKVGGTGLGLSICRQLIELHNGRIWVESEEGHGSTFTFIVPVVQPEGQPAAAEPATAEPEPPRPIVLVVDDDQALTGLYRRYLEPHGYRVIGVGKSTEAMTRAAELRPVCILLDVLMPNKDGWQVLADLKRSEITRDIPVIMCTLVSDPDRAYALGAADYLTKPILEADLLRAINKLPGHIGRPAAVLLIEDHVDDAAFVRRALSSTGVRLLEARDGQTGLTLAHIHRPQAIILDLQMPDMDGFQVLAALRNDPLTRDIPIVVVTANELNAEQQTRLARQVAGWRQKGQFQAEDLLGDLRSVVATARV